MIPCTPKFGFQMGKGVIPIEVYLSDPKVKFVRFFYDSYTIIFMNLAIPQYHLILQHNSIKGKVFQ